MKVETTFLDDHQVRLEVEIDPLILESNKKRAAKRLAKGVKIPGFRPGKAPYPVILRHLGEATILDEAIEILIKDIYPEIIETAEIEPYGPGSLENIKGLDPPSFEFVVPLKHTVELGDYRSIRRDYQIEPVSQDDIDDVVKNLQEQYAIVETVERPVQTSDLVYALINAKRINAPEGDDLELIKERLLPVIVESDDAVDDEEWPFPGFSNQLIGMTAGDKKQLSHTYEQDSPIENFRGIEAQYDIEIKEVRSRTLPDVNDEFAQSLGDFTSAEALYSTIQSNLEAQAQDSYNNEYDNNILDQIIELSNINYPPQMLERELDEIIDNLEGRLKQQGMSLDLYLKSRQIDMAGLREETIPVAEKRLKRTLVLLEIANTEDVQVDPQELQLETEKTLGEASKVLPEKEYRKLANREITSNIVGNIMMEMIVRKTQTILRGNARGITETTNGDDDSDTREDGMENDQSLEVVLDDTESDVDEQEDNS